jgi:hypothetical protein
MRVRYSKKHEAWPETINLLGLVCPAGVWVEASERQASKASCLGEMFEVERELVLEPTKPAETVLEPTKEPEPRTVEPVQPKALTSSPLVQFRRGPGRPRKA